MLVWFDQVQRKGQDVHLAAELGKMLLERNAELDTALQQVCTTNQEQAYQIRHLTQRVAVLGSVNEQAARAAEVAEATVREAELEVKRLRKAERLSYRRELGELVEELQSRLEEVEQATRARSVGQIGSSGGTTRVTMKGEVWFGQTLARSRRHSLPENLSNSAYPKEERCIFKKNKSWNVLFVSVQLSNETLRSVVIRLNEIVTHFYSTSFLITSDTICTKGISILQEIDAKYQALLHRYEEHLAACQEERPCSSSRTCHESRSTPEYKQLFQEVFARTRSSLKTTSLPGLPMISIEGPPLAECHFKSLLHICSFIQFID
uniref:Uncharacterized protein n=1 Tax=Eptatretus burgeri TaxID=7764 RepID=A0A8C4R852_EPTBU